MNEGVRGEQNEWRSCLSEWREVGVQGMLLRLVGWLAEGRASVISEAAILCPGNLIHTISGAAQPLWQIAARHNCTAPLDMAAGGMGEGMGEGRPGKRGEGDGRAEGEERTWTEWRRREEDGDEMMWAAADIGWSAGGGVRRLNSGWGQRLDEDWSTGNLTFKYCCYFSYTFNVIRKVSRSVRWCPKDVQFDIWELQSQIQFL